MTNILLKIPALDKLSDWHQQNGTSKILKNNGHIHTPFSFSSFTSIEQAFQLAQKENIKILGINDFFVTDGYDDFNEYAKRYKIFPLFNIEFIGLLKEEQTKGIRINDPNNPGRIYFSGKGLNYPLKLAENNKFKLDSLREESQIQVEEMILKANDLLGEISELSISYEEIKQKYAKELVRERHIAKAIREKAFEQYTTVEERNKFFKDLYNGKSSKVDINNPAALEDEIRGMILKKGGVAFVEEDDNAFLDVKELIDIVLDAGGIPCYPVLLDDKNGNINEFEADYEKMYAELVKRNIYCIELIPTRNDFAIMKKFVEFFHEKGFIVLMGTEHNTPQLTPLTVDCRGGVALDESLMKISHQGACVIAAHQYLKSQGLDGFYTAKGKARVSEKESLVKIGQAVIEYFLNN